MPAKNEEPKLEEKIEMPVEEKAVLPEGHVMVRITKFGNGKVSNGEPLVFGAPQPSFKTGDMVVLPLDIAQALEARAFAEIQED